MNENPNPKRANTTDPLVTELQTRQKELGLTNTRFAQMLGISRPLWVMTLNGQRVVNVTLLRGVAQAFPDLDAQVLTFLRSENE